MPNYRFPDSTGTVVPRVGVFVFQPSNNADKPWNHGPRGLLTVVVATNFQIVATGNNNRDKWVALVSDDGSCVNAQ